MSVLNDPVLTCEISHCERFLRTLENEFKKGI